MEKHAYSFLTGDETSKTNKTDVAECSPKSPLNGTVVACENSSNELQWVAKSLQQPQIEGAETQSKSPGGAHTNTHTPVEGYQGRFIELGSAVRVEKRDHLRRLQLCQEHRFGVSAMGK